MCSNNYHCGGVVREAVEDGDGVVVAVMQLKYNALVWSDTHRLIVISWRHLKAPERYG